MSDKTDLPGKGAILQRDRETYAIAPHIPGGIILDVGVLRKIADVAEKYNAKALKLTSAQRIAIVGIEEDKIDAAWADLGMPAGAAIGMCVRSIRICPAMHFCKRAQQDSVTLGLEIDKKYHGAQFPNKVKFAVSGCGNSCSESHVKDIGLIGAKNGYKVFIGGNAGAKARIGNLLAENVPQEEVMPLIEKILAYYKENARKSERMGMMIDRLGFDVVKQGILG